MPQGSRGRYGYDSALASAGSARAPIENDATIGAATTPMDIRFMNSRRLGSMSEKFLSMSSS